MKELINRLTQEFMDKDYAHAYMDSHQSFRIATQIKILREQRQLTQIQLAELSKMKQERISALEDVDYDSWTISTLRKLAKAFDTTLQISFVPFSQGILDISDIGREHLQVESRKDDLEHFAKSVFTQTNDKIGYEFEFKELTHYGLPLASQMTCNQVNEGSNLESVTYRNNFECVANDNLYQDAA